MAEPDLQRLSMQYEQLQRELQAAERRIAALAQGLEETQRAAATLRGIAEMEAPGEALLPVGAGVFVRATVDPAAPVVRPLGGDYATEGDVDAARQALEERAEAFQRAYQDAEAGAQRLAEALERIAQSAGV